MQFKLPLNYVTKNYQKQKGLFLYWPQEKLFENIQIKLMQFKVLVTKTSLCLTTELTILTYICVTFLPTL